MLARISLCATMVALFSSQALLIMPGLSSAAEWFAAPSVRVASQYDENIQLTIQPHKSTSGSTVSPKLNLGVRSDIWELNGSAEYEHKKYSDAELDTNNQYFNLGSSYRTERNTWQLSGSSVKSSVLANQKIYAGIDQYLDRVYQGVLSQYWGNLYSIPTPIAVNAQTHRNQELRSISPSWVWAMDERKQVQLSYQYSSTSYVNGSSVGLSDNSTRGVSARLSNQLDATNQVFFSAGYSVYRAPSVAHATEIDKRSIYLAEAIYPKLLASESKSASYQVGISHTFSETLSGGVSGGAWKTSAERSVQTCLQPGSFDDYLLSVTPACLVAGDTVMQKSRTTSFIFSGNLEKNFESTRANASLSRTFNPSSAGDQAQTDTLNLAYSHIITEKLTGNYSVTASKYSSEVGGISGFNYNLYQISPRLDWRWTPEVLVNMAYGYARTKRSWEPEPVASNSIYISLTYQWPRFSFSR